MKYYECIEKLKRLQKKYDIICNVNVDLREGFTKLLNMIKNDLRFLELNWLKDTPIIEGLRKKYRDIEV